MDIEQHRPHNPPLVARQPIFDRQMRVYAYELLYRDGGISPPQKSTERASGDQATATVLTDLLTGMELEGIVGERKAFINMPLECLEKLANSNIEFQKIVFEILEDIKPGEHLNSIINILTQQGHPLALDDYAFEEGKEDILEQVDIVKVDIQLVDRENLLSKMERLRSYPVQLLAEKVETSEDLQLCHSLGFQYFQGFFFAKPQEVRENRIPSDRLQILTFLKQLHEPEASFAELAGIVRQDPSLSYRLLRLVNSPFFPTRVQVESVQQALVLLGLSELRTWATWLSLARINDRPPELLRHLLVRAKFCQGIGKILEPERGEPYFLAGLFSGMDAVFGRPLKELLGKLPLSEDLCMALLEFKGEYGHVLKAVLDFEKGDMKLINNLGISEKGLMNLYYEAVSESDSLCASLS